MHFFCAIMAVLYRLNSQTVSSMSRAVGKPMQMALYHFILRKEPNVISLTILLRLMARPQARLSRLSSAVVTATTQMQSSSVACKV